MATSVLLQDWTTIRGNLTTTVVTQPVGDYADLIPCRNMVAYFEISDILGGPSMGLQTSPTRDDNLFQFMDGSTFAPTIGMNPRIYRYSAATVPLARYLRWKITGSSSAPWSMSFRIWLSTKGKPENHPSMLLAQRDALAQAASAMPGNVSMMLPRSAMNPQRSHRGSGVGAPPLPSQTYGMPAGSTSAALAGLGVGQRPPR